MSSKTDRTACYLEGVVGRPVPVQVRPWAPAIKSNSQRVEPFFGRAFLFWLVTVLVTTSEKYLKPLDGPAKPPFIHAVCHLTKC